MSNNYRQHNGFLSKIYRRSTTVTPAVALVALLITTPLMSACSQGGTTGGYQRPADSKDVSDVLRHLDEEAQNQNDSTTPAKDGFDEETNTTLTVAGVEFELPAYFGEGSVEGEETLYYAERIGDGVVLRVREESAEGLSSQQFYGSMPDDIDIAVDEIAELEELDDVDSGDLVRFELAGLPAYRFTIEGVWEDERDGEYDEVAFVGYMVVFLNEKTGTQATLLLTQTDSARYDYTGDFDQVVDSAVLAGTQADSNQKEL